MKEKYGVPNTGKLCPLRMEDIGLIMEKIPTSSRSRKLSEHAQVGRKAHNSYWLKENIRAIKDVLKGIRNS